MAHAHVNRVSTHKLLLTQWDIDRVPRLDLNRSFTLVDGVGLGMIKRAKGHTCNNSQEH